MEYTGETISKIENHCFACLRTEETMENIAHNKAVLEIFRKTFNLQLPFDEGFPKYFCVSCQEKLNGAAEFLAQVELSMRYIQSFKKIEHDVKVNVKQEQSGIKFEDCPHNNDDDSFANKSTKETKSDSESDNEPLIKWAAIKAKRKRKNTFNPKLKRIPLDVVAEAIEDYKDGFKENANCILCEFKGLNIRNLSCHMLFKHKDQKNDWCLRCNTLVEDIESHKRTHTNRVWCKFCRKGITRCHYMEHLKAHAGIEFSYEECCKKFIPQKAVEEHTLQHKQEKSFQCYICNKSFKLLKNLEIHLYTHGRYKCDVCQKNFEIPELLASHFCSGKSVKNINIIRKQSEDNFEENHETNYDNLDNDVKEHIEIKMLDEYQDLVSKDTFDVKKEETTLKLKPDIQIESLTCHFCQRTYKTAYKLQKHIEAHMGIFLAKCQYCDKGFSSKADLANHERVHTKEKPFICSACGKGFVSGATLRIHMKQHTGKPEECELCHKRFSRKSELKLHLQKHRGERPFLCTDCGKSFAQKSHLTCHITMHSEERPYACILCDKAFKKKELLKHHMKLHGEKNFKCSVCFYECHKKYRLQQHMKMHEGKTGIKGNPCQLCNRSFSSIQLLNVHMGNAHNVIM